MGNLSTYPFIIILGTHSVEYRKRNSLYFVDLFADSSAVQVSFEIDSSIS